LLLLLLLLLQMPKMIRVLTFVSKCRISSEPGGGSRMKILYQVR
jgi:hypothetical protein